MTYWDFFSTIAIAVLSFFVLGCVLWAYDGWTRND